MSAPRTGSPVGELTDLMRQMGSKDGFDPMPPSQHGYLLDVGESATDRAIAWMWSKTIHPGRGRKRSPFARDERGALTLKHAAADLGWEMSNASATFSKLSNQGRIKKDPKGHFYLEGDVPPPRRTNSESLNQAEEDENQSQPICTYKLPKAFELYLQQLPKNESVQRQQDYFRLQEYRKKIEADAMAAARATGQDLEQKYFQAIGFEHKTLRGRPKVEREDLAVQLSLTSLPHLSVHISQSVNSVQNGNGVPYKSENGSVHINPSLLSSSEYSENRVSKSPRAEIQHAIKEALGVNLPLTHSLLTQFQNLSKKEGLPIASLCRWIHSKVREKVDQRYPIQGAKALYQFAEKDLLPWAKQHPDEIRLDQPTAIQPERKPPNLTPQAEPEWKKQDRIDAAEDWLSEFPNHPDAERTRQQLAELRGGQARTAGVQS